MIKEICNIISTKFNVDPKLEHILGWEALWALTQGIEKAQSLDTTAVKNALETMDTIENSVRTRQDGRHRHVRNQPRSGQAGRVGDPHEWRGEARGVGDADPSVRATVDRLSLAPSE